MHQLRIIFPDSGQARAREAGGVGLPSRRSGQKARMAELGQWRLWPAASGDSVPANFFLERTQAIPPAADRGSLSRGTPEPQTALVLLRSRAPFAPAAGHGPAPRPL